VTQATPPPNLRTRKKQATRESLEEAALRLFSEKGFAETTVDEIAAAANVSPRTFARYFTSKEAAAVGHPFEHLEVMREAIRTEPSGDPRVIAANALRTLAASFEGERDLTLSRMLLAAREPAIRLRMYEWQLAGEIAMVEELTRRRPDGKPVLQVRLLASLMMGAFLVAIRDWVRFQGNTTLVALMDRVLAELPVTVADSSVPVRGD
jgi:AcrR family transcriptional regulator